MSHRSRSPSGRSSGRGTGSPGGKRGDSPTLPSKVYDCGGIVVLVQDILQAGVAELTGGDGNTVYCFFQAKDVVAGPEGGTGLGEKLPLGSKVRCNAWLLDEAAKIPYLVSTAWQDRAEYPASAVDKILGMPAMADMEVYNKLSKDLAWSLSSNRKSSKEKESKGRDERDGRKKSKRRSRSRSRERKRGRSRSRDRKLEPRDAMLERRSKSGETGAAGRERGSHSRDKRHGREPPGLHRTADQLLARNFTEQEEAAGRGRGGFSKGVGRGAGFGKKPLAIGRNVFNPSDEEEGGARGRGRRRGRAGHRNDHDTRSRDEDRPGLGFKPKPKENSRWKRWQELSRARPGEAGEQAGEDGNTSHLAELARQTSPVSPEQSEEGATSTIEPGQAVTVLTYETEEVGLLAGGGRRVLFNIRQVWTQHPAFGYCPFREILPSADLSKHLYPGREVRCWADLVTGARGASHQASAVWLEGQPPPEQLFR